MLRISAKNPSSEASQIIEGTSLKRSTLGCSEFFRETREGGLGVAGKMRSKASRS